MAAVFLRLMLKLEPFKPTAPSKDILLSFAFKGFHSNGLWHHEQLNKYMHGCEKYNK
jgi:hypothetical protein